MNDLKQLYRHAVATRVAEIESALGSHRAPDAEMEEALRRIAHSLRGSGGTYGFPEVSTAAALVEDAPTSEIMERSHHLLGVLRGLVAGAAHSARVLVIDDDPEILLLLTTVLAADDRHISTATSGAAAARQLAKEPFSLVIVDLLLPDVDGMDILRGIRNDNRFDQVPVIVLSARTTADTRRDCAALGATAFFEKPFDPEAVAAAVVAQLQRAANADPGAMT